MITLPSKTHIWIAAREKNGARESLDGYIVSGCWELKRKFQLAPNSKRQAGNCDAAESAKLSAARTGWPWCGNRPTTAFRARSSGVGQRVRVFTVRRSKILCISV